jgi:acetoin utilization deacetylase AcuC-like enzyme
MHQRDIYPIPKEKGDRDIALEAGTDDQTYLGILREELFGVIDRSRPELVIFQAGCDVLSGDPLAELALTAEGILRRDSYVIDTCVAHGIPVMMTLGGGYIREAWTIQHASIRQIIDAHGCLRGRGA